MCQNGISEYWWHGRKTNVIEATTWRPRVFVGAPTGSLTAQTSAPEHRPCPVAIEIADGIGFGIDGEALIVGDGGADGTYSIQGHVEDGGYPQRDFTVERSGNDTRVNGFFGWQDYTLHRDQNVVEIKGESDGETMSVTSMSQGLVVFGKQPGQRYFVGVGSSNVVTVEGYTRHTTTQVIFEEDHITIKDPAPERSFEITRTPEGFHVHGAVNEQSYDVKHTANGFIIQGPFPQQRYVVTRTSPAAC